MEVGVVRKLYVEVMSSEAALRRFAAAWKKVSAGKMADATIGLGSIAELAALLTPKRMELLRHVALNPGLSIRALAKALGRNYKNVHTDVSDLEVRQLLERDKEGMLSAPYDEIVIRAPLRKAA